MINEAIFAELTENAGVADLIDAGSGKFHLYPLRLPDGFPNSADYAISYTEISQSRVFPALKVSNMQFSCFGRTYDQANELASAVDSALNYLSEHKLGGELDVKFVMVLSQNALYDEVSKLWYYVIDASFKY
jgi:hypothetical protein